MKITTPIGTRVRQARNSPHYGDEIKLTHTQEEKSEIHTNLTSLEKAARGRILLDGNRKKKASLYPRAGNSGRSSKNKPVSSFGRVLDLTASGENKKFQVRFSLYTADGKS